MRNLFKLWDILNLNQRRKALALLVFMLIGMVFETLGVGLVIPALAIITNQELLLKYPAIRASISGVEHFTHKELVAGALLMLLLTYAIKAVFLAFLAWKQTRFAFDIQADFSQRLFKVYISQPWAFHLERNSAQLIRNTIGEVSTLVSNFVIPELTVIVEILVLGGIAILLVVVEPIGAILVVSILVTAALAFNHFTRMPLLRWGKELQLAEKDRIQHLQQALGGAKDVKLLGRESNFVKLYQKSNLASAHLLGNQTFLQMLPRLWLEVLAICGLVGLSLVVMSQGKSPIDLLPTLGVFAAAAFRLMPSATRLINSFQYIRHSESILENFHREIQLAQVPLNSKTFRYLSFADRVEVNAVVFKYPGASRCSVDKVSFVIPRGYSIGIIGESGAGKSTLVDLILGLLSPDSGEITVDGVSIEHNLRSWQEQIGYVPQSIYLTDDSLRRNVAFGISDEIIDDNAVWNALESAQLKDFVSGLQNGLDTIVGERGVKLSGGQRQRIGIARALYHNPQVLVLDEATSSLDIETEAGIMKAVSALHGEKTILIVAHRLSTVSHCDYLLRLENGVLQQAGAFAELVRE